MFWPRIFVLASLAANAAGAEADTMLIRNGAHAPLLLRPALVFDSASGQTHAGWSVLVISNHIAAAGPDAQVAAPANAVAIPLPGMTLLPGLMDIHSHIFLHPYNEVTWDNQVLKEPVAYRSVEAHAACQRHAAGWSSPQLRDLEHRRQQAFRRLHQARD